jgi:uncharacterized protein YndB with AHSA1/START domain
MPFHAVTIQIAAPSQRVFDCLVDPSRLREWIGGLESSEPLTDGGLRVGARSRETIRDRGRDTQLVTEVTGLIPGKLLVNRITSPMLAAESRFELEAVGEGTRLHHTLVPRYKGFLRLVAPLFRGMVQRKLEGDLARLRTLAERG